MTNESGSGDNLKDPRKALTKEEIRELIEQFEQLERDFKEIENWTEIHAYRRVRELAGPEFETMLKNMDETLKYLGDPRADLRQAALRLAYDHWNITDALAPQYEQMALADPDNDVREAAVRALGSCYSGTKDPRIGRLLASFVRKGELSDGIRMAAYLALIRLHGDLDFRGKSPIPLSIGDIDWTLVDQYNAGKKKGSG